MPDLPNIKLEVLEYVYEEADGEYDVVNLRQSPLSREYGSYRVAKKVMEIAVDHGVFNWGISPVVPWYEDERAVEAAIRYYYDV